MKYIFEKGDSSNIMNELQYLEVCLIEELSEVQQELSKCLRFSNDHRPTGFGVSTSNLERVQLEMADVYAIASLLETRHGVDCGIKVPEKMSPELSFRFRQKMDKTLRLMDVSVQLGTLEN